jgi:hypothetical protein
MIRQSRRPIEGSAVRQDNRMTTRVTSRMAHVALLVGLAIVPVLALNSLATATPTPHGGTDPRPGATDTLRTCLAEQGVTLPTPANPASPGGRARVDEQQVLQQAAKQCGLRSRIALGRLTAAQRQCVADQGVTLPERESDGTRPHLSIEQRVALQQAAVACGLPVWNRHHDRGKV